jgi:putative membrane protein
VSQTSFPTPRSTRLRYAALAAVVLVPLAFAGLFIGAVSQISHSISDIPAAIVDNDQMVAETGTDGTSTPVLAGRELVTELTGKKSAGFDWTITNSKDAKAELANGTVYAILTVPKNFSKSIVSLSSKSPVKAKLTITTDDAHNYLTGSVAQIVGSSLTSAFGQAVTKQYIAGIYSGIGGVSSALSSAASGASKLSTGASSLATGVTSYVAGVSAVPPIAGGNHHNQERGGVAGDQSVHLRCLGGDGQVERGCRAARGDTR